MLRDTESSLGPIRGGLRGPGVADASRSWLARSIARRCTSRDGS
jgi:hypothetical protein